MDLFGKIFPEYGHYVPFLRACAVPQSPLHPALVNHLWLVEEDGEAVGLRIFFYVHTRNFGYGLFVGILDSHRSRGIGGWLVQQTLAQLQVDARRFDHPLPSGYCVEVERVEEAKDETDRRVRERRLAFHIRNGACLLDVDYLEPVAPPGEEVNSRLDWPREPRPMHLLFYPMPGRGPLGADELLHVVEGLYCDVYRVSPDHPSVRRAMASILSGGE